MTHRIGHIGGLVMLLLLAASCQLVDSDKPCSGAAGIDSLQAERLACVGWLNYVEALFFHDQIITMVHEAARLEDGCRTGEPPALAAENAYVADYERHREEESATIRERVRSGNMNFDDLCLLTVYVVPGDP